MDFRVSCAVVGTERVVIEWFDLNRNRSCLVNNIHCVCSMRVCCYKTCAINVCVGVCRGIVVCFVCLYIC